MISIPSISIVSEILKEKKIACKPKSFNATWHCQIREKMKIQSILQVISNFISSLLVHKIYNNLPSLCSKARYRFTTQHFFNSNHSLGISLNVIIEIISFNINIFLGPGLLVTFYIKGNGITKALQKLCETKQQVNS